MLSTYAGIAGEKQLTLRVPHRIGFFTVIKQPGDGSGMLPNRANEWRKHSGMGELFLEDFKVLTDV